MIILAVAVAVVVAVVEIVVIANGPRETPQLLNSFFFDGAVMLYEVDGAPPLHQKIIIRATLYH